MNILLLLFKVIKRTKHSLTATRVLRESKRFDAYYKLFRGKAVSHCHHIHHTWWFENCEADHWSST